MSNVIHAANFTDFINPVIDGERKSSGLIQRDFKAFPPGYLSAAPVFSGALIMPENQWAGALAQQQADQSSMFDLRTAYYEFLKSLDQDGLGLCWAFSTTKAMMYCLAIMGVPLHILSAWWVAGTVKGWADQGGWCSESLAKIASAGVPLMSLCPSYKSSYNTAATQADAATRKVTEWWDGTEDRDQNRRIMITAFLLGMVPVLDFNWWGHSVCGCRLVSLNPLTIDIDNSWGESAGDKGIYRLTGDHAIPDNIVVPRVQSAAV